MKRLLSVLVLLILQSLGSPQAGVAHKGPPFPIIEGRRVGPYVVEVWTDPDIGTGRFFIVLQPPEGTTDLAAPSLVHVTVQPVSGRLDPAVYTTESQKASKGFRYFAAVAFDQGEMWDVEVRIEWPGGGETLKSQVEATPDGQIGPIGLVVYALPFLAVGFLWFKAIRRKRQMAREAAASSS